MKQEIISLKKINQNDLMCKEHEKVFMELNYIEQSLLVSAITGCFNSCFCFFSRYSY